MNVKLSISLKRDSNTGVFLWNLRNFRKTPILKNICERLLLNFMSSAYITLMHCKARQFHPIYIVLTKEMALKWHLWQQLLKSTPTIWKPRYAFMTWCRQESDVINYTFKFSQKSCLSLLAKGIKIIFANLSNKLT